MKKTLYLGFIVLLLLAVFLGGCDSTPKAPVAKHLDLDTLVADGMTIAQVDELMKPELKSSYTLYQATNATLSSGKWSVHVPEGGIPAGETGDYQVMYFNPEKGQSQYFAIFFKAGVSIGTAWFDSSNGVLMEKLLKGESLTTTTTNTTTATN